MKKIYTAAVAFCLLTSNPIVVHAQDESTTRTHARTNKDEDKDGDKDDSGKWGLAGLLGLLGLAGLSRRDRKDRTDRVVTDRTVR